MDTICAPVITRTDIRSSLSPSYTFADLKIGYLSVVTRALTSLFEECNRAFASLVEANREWDTDYGYCAPNGYPANWIVQIDMAGLDLDTLSYLSGIVPEDVPGELRRRIFEIENSWALYQILSQVCTGKDGAPSYYGRKTLEVLEAIRRQYDMPIALLAVTDAKWESMRATEFGALPGQKLCDAEVRELSGFDRLFGPAEFKRHVEACGGRSEYLLYVRASDPVEKLKHPLAHVEHPLLGDPNMRRVIKQYALTLNVDDPKWPVGDVRRINDTKRYMPAMDMATEVKSEAEFIEVAEWHDNPLDENYVRLWRAKPIQGTYGCYGHERGEVSDKDFRRRVRRGINQRGPYIVQPEIAAPTVLNTANGQEYAYVDRVFCGLGPEPMFLGGHREFLPIDSPEVRSGRLHGNRETVYAEILPA